MVNAGQRMRRQISGPRVYSSILDSSSMVMMMELRVFKFSEMRPLLTPTDDEG